MTAYESIFILRPDLDEEAVNKTCDRITALIPAHGGSVIALEKVGKRRLAYEVKGQLDGFYGILNYEGTGATSAELERTYKISDEVILHILVKRDVPYKPAQIREPAKEAVAAAAPEGAAKETEPEAEKVSGEDAPAAPAPASEAQAPAAVAGETAGAEAAPAGAEASESKPE